MDIEGGVNKAALDIHAIFFDSRAVLLIQLVLAITNPIYVFLQNYGMFRFYFHD
jgi:hypothetical protein